MNQAKRKAIQAQRIADEKLLQAIEALEGTESEGTAEAEEGFLSYLEGEEEIEVEAGMRIEGGI